MEKRKEAEMIIFLLKKCGGGWKVPRWDEANWVSDGKQRKEE
jgi:hypothetical protein